MKTRNWMVVGCVLACVVAGCASAPECRKTPCGCEKSKYVVVEDTTGQREWKMPFRLGLAGYTMCKKSLDETLEIMRSVDLHYLCVKDFHLKYTASDVEMDGRDSWDKRKGSRKQLEYIDMLVKEFDIKYAIHNHGPNAPEMFPDVAYGWNLVKDLDKRIGFCLDVGWEYGSDHDLAATIRRYGDRIFDLHLKNFAINLPGAGKIGKNSFTTVPMPRGAMDYGTIFKALVEVGYDGVCSFEYERDFENNLEGLAESVGYARGVCDTLPQ